MSFSLGDDLEDLGSYLRIEQPDANTQSRQISYEDRKTPPDGNAQAHANEAWVVGRAETAPDRSKKRRLPEETTMQDAALAGSSTEPLAGSRPRRAAREAAMATIRQAVVEPETSGGAGTGGRAGAGTTGGEGSQYGGGSDDDDDGQGGGGVGRRGRKNERERQRRLEVNEGFERLGTILAVERRFKAEKAVVLQKAIEEILSLRQQVADLSALLVGVGSTVAALGSGAAAVAQSSASSALQTVLPAQPPPHAAAPLAAPVPQAPNHSRPEHQPAPGVPAVPASATAAAWSTGGTTAPAQEGTAMQEDTHTPAKPLSIAGSTGGGRKRGLGSSSVQLAYSGSSAPAPAPAPAPTVSHHAQPVLTVSAPMMWQGQTATAQAADPFASMKTAAVHPAMAASSSVRVPSSHNGASAVPAASNVAATEYTSARGPLLQQSAAAQTGKHGRYRNQIGSFGDMFDLQTRAEIAPASGLLPPVPGMYADSQGHGPGAFVVHRGGGGSLPTSTVAHVPIPQAGAPSPSPAGTRHVVSALQGASRTGPGSIVDGLDMEHLHLREMNADMASGLGAIPPLAVLGDPFLDDGGLSSVLPEMYSELSNHFYQNSLGMGGSHVRHGGAQAGILGAGGGSGSAGLGLGGGGGGLLTARMTGYR